MFDDESDGIGLRDTDAVVDKLDDVVVVTDWLRDKLTLADGVGSNTICTLSNRKNSAAWPVVSVTRICSDTAAVTPDTDSICELATSFDSAHAGGHVQPAPSTL